LPHRLRKIRKKRGSRTVGYGRVGQHRKSGSKGRRKVGLHKQGWSYILRYEPDYYGKAGFKSPKSLMRPEVNTINLKELEELALKTAPKKRAKGVKRILIDLEKLGYDKLLGEGRITIPLKVKVPSCSEVAARKIMEAGGEVLSAAEEGSPEG